MKKFFILGLAVLFCLSLTGSAGAAAKMGGSIAIDFGYVNLDKDLPGTGGQDQSYVEFAADKIFTRWNGRFESDDGKLIGMIEIRGGAAGQTYSPVTGQTTYSDDINWSYAYIVWRPVKNQSFQIGYQTVLFADQAPGPYPLLVGFTRGTTATGYGEFNHAARNVGFRWMTRFSDMIRFEAALYNPGNSGGFGDYRDLTGDASIPVGVDVYDPTDLTLPPQTVLLGFLPASNGSEENIIPRIEAKLPIYVGGTRICFAGTYGQQNYKNIGGVVTGDPAKDESFNVYGLSGNINWPIGIFTVTAEAFWGQNLGAGPWGGSMGPTASFSQPVWNHDTGSFENATTMAGWISASVKLGPGSLGGYFSYIDDKVDDPVEIKSTRNSFGFNYMMPLGKGFMMRPVINFYDNGDPEVDGVSSKGGTLMNAGIQFSLGF